jgi:hypothetical protein
MLDTKSYTFERPHRQSKTLIPKSVFFIASIILAHLKRKYKQETEINFELATALLNSIFWQDSINPETGQQPSLALAPQLRAKPWWKSSDDPILAHVEKKLKEQSDTIIVEFLEQEQLGTITKSYRAAKRYGDNAEKAWTGYQLSNIMGVRQEVKIRFPKTAELIESLGFRVLSSDFLCLAPNFRLPIHTDGTNLVIACHLGITGEERCALSVSKKAESMSPGKIVFFDQSFPHTAWNHSDKKRVVMLLSMLHPDISELEFLVAKEFIRKTRRLSYFFAPFIAAEFLLLSLARKLK